MASLAVWTRYRSGRPYIQNPISSRRPSPCVRVIYLSCVIIVFGRFYFSFLFFITFSLLRGEIPDPDRRRRLRNCYTTSGSIISRTHTRNNIPERARP